MFYLIYIYIEKVVRKKDKGSRGLTMISDLNEDSRVGIDFSSLNNNKDIFQQQKNKLLSSCTTPLNLGIENEDSREPSYNSTLLAEGEGRFDINFSATTPIEKNQQPVKFKHKMKNVKKNGLLLNFVFRFVLCV